LKFVLVRIFFFRSFVADYP